MCGITGIISINKNFNLPESIKTLNDSLSHRGPDDKEIYVNNFLALGHNRLSIIDLTKDSKQPIISNCKRYILVFNGMIYNYIELANSIYANEKTKKSDTLVLLEYISKFGVEKALKDINGMFAIAVYDFQEKKVYLARDRFGKKPLYFLNNGMDIIFASEIKAILSIAKNIKLNHQIIENYFNLGFSTGEGTFYTGIKQVEPGTILIKKIHEENYNIINNDNIFENYDQKFLKTDFNIKTIEELIEESVKLRLRSDVKTGIFLSGGIDSGLIKAFAS